MKRILAYTPILRAELQAFIQAKRSIADGTNRWEVDLMDRLLPFATTGKLLRGSLVCFSYEALSGRSPDDAVIKAALAIELTHSGLLIHDDIMDGDELRRGQPSLHHQYQTVADDSGLRDASQFGVNMAICGGDVAFFLAFELLAQAGKSPVIRTTLNQLFVEQLVNTCMGQMQDVYFEARSATPSKTEIYSIMRAKTASYTLALPLAMGAALAEQSAVMLHDLQAIGAAAGTIFQIRDDELGALGNSKETGKPVGSDIREGKKTLAYYYLMKQCRPDERRQLKTIFGNPATSTADIRFAQKLMRRYQIPRLLDGEIERLAEPASKRIAKLQIPDQTKTELHDLVAFCGNRAS